MVRSKRVARKGVQRGIICALYRQSISATMLTTFHNKRPQAKGPMKLAYCKRFLSCGIHIAE